MQQVLPVAPVKSVSADEAGTWTLVALIFHVLFSIGTALVIFLFFGILAIFGNIFWVIGAVLIGLIVLSLYIGVDWCYLRIRRGDYDGARAPTLILGILGIVFGGIITGVFYLLAYSKLGDAIRERTAPMVAVPVTAVNPYFVAYAPAPGYAVPGAAPMYVASPYPTAAPYPAAAPYPTAAPPLATTPPPAPPQAPATPTVCARCRQATTYVPEYQRYYCHSCHLYA